MNSSTTALVEVAGHRYSIGKLSALSQFHVMRRLAPLLAGVGPDLLKIPEAKDTGEMLGLMSPLAQALADLKDEDANYVIFTCLSVVSREQSSGWARMVAGSPPALMFEDIDMFTMIRLTVEVVQENFRDFFKELGGEIASASS